MHSVDAEDLTSSQNKTNMGGRKKGGIVYSTGLPSNGPEPEISEVAPADQDLRIHLDRLKGNKLATRVVGHTGSEKQLTELGKTLKGRCGVGGSSKNGIILLQGDHRDKVLAILHELGYNAKKSGG